MAKNKTTAKAQPAKEAKTAAKSNKGSNAKK